MNLTIKKLLLKSKYSSKALYINAFDFSSFINNYKFIDQSWLEWFVGFSEGDGSWTISNSRFQAIFFSGFYSKRNCYIVSHSRNFRIWFSNYRF
jgi:hypothetical protein